MAKHIEFYPPKLSPAAIRLAYAVLPFALRRWGGVRRLSIPDADLARLGEVTAHRCIIAPNHPSRIEPMIVADLARRLGRSFYFVSARENFETAGGHIMQKLGAYSIARGLPDRASLSMTRSLLAEQDRPVVLFPEGEVYHHNDLMLPLNSGVAQIGFWALADVIKLGKTRSLPIAPIAIKYRFLGDVAAFTLRRIERLERAVGIGKPQDDWRVRVHAIGGKIVETLEDRYRLPGDGSIPDRIDRLRLCIIRRGFAILGITPRDEGAAIPEQMRSLFNALHDFKAESAGPLSEYERKIALQRSAQVQMVMQDLARIHDSILTTGHYVSDRPTFERLSELLGRMEDEVFGRHVRYASREALIRVAEPLDIATLSDEYEKSKRGAVASATAEIARRIGAMLEELAPVGTAIPGGLWPANETSTAELQSGKAGV